LWGQGSHFLQALIIFQIYKYDNASYHTRLTPFKGLEAFMTFISTKLLDFPRDGIDATGNIQKLVGCVERLKDHKSMTSKGLQNRNMFPHSNIMGAINLGGSSV
jgi:hypothetical protein